jgi:hypothetical protein
MAWILAAVVLVPCTVNAADDRAALLHKADFYAAEAKQYGAAGKPATNALAKRYARLSETYRGRAAAAESDR